MRHGRGGGGGRHRSDEWRHHQTRSSGHTHTCDTATTHTDKQTHRSEHKTQKRTRTTNEHAASERRENVCAVVRGLHRTRVPVCSVPLTAGGEERGVRAQHRVVRVTLDQPSDDSARDECRTFGLNRMDPPPVVCRLTRGGPEGYVEGKYASNKKHPNPYGVSSAAAMRN